MIAPANMVALLFMDKLNILCCWIFLASAVVFVWINLDTLDFLCFNLASNFFKASFLLSVFD